jgi:4-aminobutyrate aminotransferase-like enzyme
MPDTSTMINRFDIEILDPERVHLHGADGQASLDAYNYVPSVGHCHLRVVEAIARQAATLNTHNRYAAAMSDTLAALDRDALREAYL